MSLQQLVNHFNYKFEQEHQCSFQPFLLSNNKVTGIFGVARINSEFTPIRNLSHPEVMIAGYAAKAFAPTDNPNHIRNAKVKKLLKKTLNKPAHVRSIVSFDRLCRTVHVLNYLTLASNASFLITEVDPHHILGVPYHHGAYFQQVILRAGLTTENVVISMSIMGVHQLHFPKLLKGLSNYRELGYKLALNVGHFSGTEKVVNFIKQLAPDYLLVNAPQKSKLTAELTPALFDLLAYLKGLATQMGGKLIMQQVEFQKQIVIAQMAGFDFLLGDVYQDLSQIDDEAENIVSGLGR